MVEMAFAAESVDSVDPEGWVDREDSVARLDSVLAAHRLSRHSILLPILFPILLPILRHKIPIGEGACHGPA